MITGRASFSFITLQQSQEQIVMMLLTHVQCLALCFTCYFFGTLRDMVITLSIASHRDDLLETQNYLRGELFKRGDNSR